MSPRRRITLALVGLVILVVVGWLTREAATDGRGSSPGTPGSAPVEALAFPDRFGHDHGTPGRPSA